MTEAEKLAETLSDQQLHRLDSAKGSALTGPSALVGLGLMEREPEDRPKRGFKILTSGTVPTWTLTPKGRAVVEAARRNSRLPYLGG